MHGYYCPSCNQTFSERPPDGLCPDCPVEPVHDLSHPQGLAAAYAAEAEERERAAAPAMPLSFLGGLIGAVLCGGGAYYLTQEVFGADGETVGGATFGAAVTGAAVIGVFFHWLAVRRARSALPKLDANTPVCAACGAAGVNVLGDDAYHCRHCGHEGGAGLVRVLRERIERDARAVPVEQRAERAQNTLIEVDGSLAALEGGLSGSPHQFSYTREDAHGNTHTEISRDSVLAAVSRDVVVADNGLLFAATLLEDDSLRVDLHQGLRERLSGVRTFGELPPEAGDLVRELRQRVARALENLRAG